MLSKPLFFHGLAATAAAAVLLAGASLQTPRSDEATLSFIEHDADTDSVTPGAQRGGGMVSVDNWVAQE